MSSFKLIYSTLKIDFFDSFFFKTNLFKSFNEITYSTENFLNFIYPYKFVNYYKRLFLFFLIKNYIFESLIFLKTLKKIKKFNYFKKLIFRKVFNFSSRKINKNRFLKKKCLTKFFYIRLYKKSFFK
jgi:hypothetical protein